MPAIFIGRFQPFHNGHLEAIKWILKKERNILIVIGSMQEFSTKNNPLYFKERKEILEKTLFSRGIKNVKLLGTLDFSDDIIWAKTILRITNLKPKEATVYTRNPWTKKCFNKINVDVKEHPLFFNGLSATQIREKIAQNKGWKNLVPKEVLDELKRIQGEERIRASSILPEERIINFIGTAVEEAGAKGGIVGISGGIDSSVTAFLTKKALGKRTIFLNITFIKTCLLINNISLLEKKIKTKVKRIYLGDIYETLLKILPKGNKISEGNLKPRLRMLAFYYFANLYNLLVIGTTNKSEMELGYFTKFGDGGADIEPIGDLCKTEVLEMAKRLKLPRQIIETVPSADLWPGQTDEKEIGIDYQGLDTVLKLLFQGFKEKEISFLTALSEDKIKSLAERKIKNLHKLLAPPICRLK